MTDQARRAPAHAGVCRNRSRADQGFAPARLPAQLRGLVHLRDRLQSLAQPDHQRNDQPQRHADRHRHRSDLRDLSLARAPDRPYRQCRRPDRRRDRSGHVDDRRRRRLGHALHREPGARDAEPRHRQGPRRAALDRRDAGARHARHGREQLPAGAEPEGLQAGDQPAAGQSRSGAQRKPDRSAHLARQPQVFRPDARQVHRAERRHRRADERCC